MASPKDVLVVTTPSIDGAKIKKYLKPVSAHIVTGTNLFSDFLGGMTDIFGGRSQTYQKQLSSIYNEAIERIKYAAYEIGANCILGLNIDMDEISGKGKSMFMLTAVGTAVIIEKETIAGKEDIHLGIKFENVAVDRINILRQKKEIIEKANDGNLTFTDEVWSFITSNQVDEIFPTILIKFAQLIKEDYLNPGTSANFYSALLGYIDALPGDKNLQLLYHGIKNSENEKLVLRLSDIIKDLHLYDYNLSMELLKSEDFRLQKRGLRIVTFDKPFFNTKDKEDLQSIRNYITNSFPERGKRTTKKQLLGKEKEVWICECSHVNDIGTYCGECNRNIHGFMQNEYKPADVDDYIKQKMELISEFVD